MKALSYFQKVIKQKLKKYKYIDKDNVMTVKKYRGNKKYKKAEFYYLVKGENYKNVFVLETSSAKGKTKKQWLKTKSIIEQIIKKNVLAKTKLEFVKFLYIGLY